ncbi:PREDICTED: disks large 1 tumor suppressor protein-like, partial [Cariama cristata]|uniref:disks large 1 tumor suppressor protein-like n=1 Tax=Cariama cristata TaxID=54380 RepID=UPI000520F2B6
METREVLVHYIQEFYEVTLLNSQKSYEQKIEEANQVAEKWEKTTSATDHENLQKTREAAASNGSEGSGQCGEHKENQSSENYVVDMKAK